MRVSTRLVGALALVMTIVVVLLVHHVRALNDAVATSYELSEIAGRLSVTSSEQAVRLNQIEENASKYWLTRDPGYRAKLDELVAEFDAALAALGERPLGELEALELTRLSAGWRALQPLVDRLYAESATVASVQGDPMPAMRAVLSALRSQNRRVGVASQEVMEIRLDESAATAQRVERISIFAVLGALVLSGGIGLAIIHSFTSQLRRLRAGTREVAGGNFEHRIDATGGDEFSELARDFNAMTRRLGELEGVKHEFLSKVSHDLKTPLASMQETNRILLDEVPGPLTASQHKLVDLSRKCGVRLSSMIGNILDLASLDDGVLRPVITTCDPAIITATAVEQIEPLLSDVSVRLVDRTTPEPITVPCDPDRMHRVLINLLENAIRHSPPGAEVELELAAARSRPGFVPADDWSRAVGGAGGRGVAVLTISDRGPGVAPEDRVRIFHEFFQTDAGRRVRNAGIGLGLAICHEIVEAHSGVIGAAGRPGGGSRFYVLLPGAEAAVTEPAIPAGVA